jgi:hypothetical protein
MQAFVAPFKMPRNVDERRPSAGIETTSSNRARRPDRTGRPRTLRPKPRGIAKRSRNAIELTVLLFWYALAFNTLRPGLPFSVCFSLKRRSHSVRREVPLA